MCVLLHLSFLCFSLFANDITNNGRRTEWSPIWSLIIRVINKIGRPQSGGLICQSRIRLQTELDNAKSCYQLIITTTISEKKNIYLGQTSPVGTMSKVKNLEISFFFQVKWLLLWLFWLILWLVDLAEWT